MRGRYCYLPILRAKAGEFAAVKSLSPEGRSRLTPLFDVPVPGAGDATDIDDYLNERAERIYHACGPDWGSYVDVHDLPADQRTSAGAQPISYLFERLRMRGAICIPVTGTETDRNTDYHSTVRSIVARDLRGACLRLAEEDIAEPQLLGSAIEWVLESLALKPSDLDVLVDLRYVGDQAPATVRAIALEALQAIHHVGSLRNVILAGGSVPQKLTRRDQGSERREFRVEWDVWSHIIEVVSHQPVTFGDYGVVYPYYAPPIGPVRPPARIRYTLPQDHIFYRAARGEYPRLCQQLLVSEHFAGEGYCVGDNLISLRAQSLIGPGSPTNWVTADTNHHLEVVSAHTWRRLNELGLLDRFSLPEPKRDPWLQTALDVFTGPEQLG